MERKGRLACSNSRARVIRRRESKFCTCPWPRPCQHVTTAPRPRCDTPLQPLPCAAELAADAAARLAQINAHLEFERECARAHQQAQQAAATADERQAPAQADESQEAPAQAVLRDQEEPVVARAVAAPINAVVVADVAPVAAVAVPPAPPAPQQERYPDVDAELLGEEIRRERTQIDGFDARATAVCDLLAEAERKLMEAERMEAALLADDGDE